MRIVLTGTTGQVGRALQKTLLEHDVLVPARAAFDLAKPDQLVAELDRLSPDLIINPAAYTAVDRAEDEVKRAMVINAEAPSVMARWGAACGVPLVHFSTDYVFAGDGDRAWLETDAVAPLSAYGRSKLAGEAAIREAGGAHLIVRTAWVYASQGANFLRTMIRLGRERPELRVVADQLGTPTSARSIARAIGHIINVSQDDLAERFARADGLVHLTNSGHASWHDFACAIFQGLRERESSLKVERVTAIATSDYPTKAVRPANSRLDLGRLNSCFGIVPPAWQQALSEELDVFLAEEA